MRWRPFDSLEPILLHELMPTHLNKGGEMSVTREEEEEEEEDNKKQRTSGNVKRVFVLDAGRLNMESVLLS